MSRGHGVIWRSTHPAPPTKPKILSKREKERLERKKEERKLKKILAKNESDFRRGEITCDEYRSARNKLNHLLRKLDTTKYIHVKRK